MGWQMATREWDKITRGNLTGLHYLAGNITVEIAITLFTAGAVEAVKGSLYSIKGIKYVVDLLEPVFKMINRFGDELIKPIAWMLRQGLEFGISSSRFIIKSGTDAILELYEEAGKYVVKAMRWIDAIEFDASLPRYELQLGEAWAMVTPEGNTVPFGNRVLQITRTRDGKFGVRVNTNFKNLGKLPENVLRKVDNAGWTDDLLKKLDDDLDNESLFKKFGEEPDLVDAWKRLQNAPDGIRTGIKSLTTVSKFADEGIELTFEAIQDGARILTKNGDEVGKLLKEGADEILEISDDFFVSAASSSSKKFDGITVRSNTGETFNNAGFIKNADGSIGFVEDVSSYGSQAVQNAIKQRGALRTSLTGIKSTEDAHHLFPVQSLKENQYVKKGVEGGFEFNSGSVNGIAVEKYVKATGAGRHGPHPKLTKQMEDHMNWWAEQSSVVNGQTILNKNLTPAQTAEYMRVIAEDVKETISTTTTKLNDLDLGLDHF